MLLSKRNFKRVKGIKKKGKENLFLKAGIYYSITYFLIIVSRTSVI